MFSPLQGVGGAVKSDFGTLLPSREFRDAVKIDFGTFLQEFRGWF
jgi:hypothetical protein